MEYASLDRFLAPAITAIFFLTVAAFIVVTFILDYHWRNYSTSEMRLKMMRRTYLGVSALLIFVMAIAFTFIFPLT